MNIEIFKKESPMLYEKLKILAINTYEEKHYRNTVWDELQTEKGVEINYMLEDDRKRKEIVK